MKIGHCPYLFNMATQKSWIKIAGGVDESLANDLSNKVQAKISSKKYSKRDIEDVARYSAIPISGALTVDKITLEKLRTLAVCWDIDKKFTPISSHRKILGPFIVGIKKLLFPIFRSFFKNSLEAQRHFNGTVLSLLMERYSGTSKH